MQRTKNFEWIFDWENHQVDLMDLLLYWNSTELGIVQYPWGDKVKNYWKLKTLMKTGFHRTIEIK